MKLPIRLFIQKHDNRTYTVMIPALPGLSGYGPTLEEVKQEVAEALAKRLGEIPAEFVATLAAHPNDAFARIVVDLWPHDHQGRRRRAPFKLTASLLITPQEDGQALVKVPRLSSPPLAFFVPSAEALGEIAQAEIAQYFSGAPLEVMVQYQGARHESFDAIEVEFSPRSPLQEAKPPDEQQFWALRASGVNLTAQAGEGQLRRAYRRDRDVEEVLAALADELRPSLILVGSPGSGKTAIVHEVARRIRRKECPEALHDRELWAVSGASLIAGMTFIGQWQEKLTNLVQEVRKKRHILFIEDIAGLADAGRWSKSDENMADFLKPYIQTGDVVLIGESTPERLRYTERLTPSFLAQFRTQKVEPTSDADTMSVLTAVSRTLERAEEVRIDPSALEAAAELTSRFLPGRSQPGKAVALLEQTAASIGRQQQASGAGRRSVTRKEVVTTFTRQTGLPEFILSDEAPLDLGAVRSHFVERVIGQERAASAMVDLIATVKAGLNDPEKPLGTFLFIGPTGVGKTQLAKTLAKYLFGDEQRVVRFDMSEYGDPAGLRRLIGMPGLGNEGELTAKVRSQPFCVLLLDEFEKADPQIYDIFLQVMGEGRLTDATGQTTSFQNAIVIMTSNLGARAREQRSIGLQGALRDSEAGAPAYAGARVEGETEGPDRRPSASYWQRKVEEYFRPEFVNRIDQIVVFDPLGAETVRQIARRELGEVMLRQGLVRRNLLLEVDDNVIDLLLDQGFNTAYGARPLKRAVERLVVLPLARYLASRGRVESDLLRLERRGDEVVLSTSRLSGEERTAEVLLGGEMLAGGLKRRRVDDRDLVEAFAELRRQLQDWAERDAVVEMRNERANLLAETNKPTFWDDGHAARAIMSRFYFLDRLLRRLQQLSDRAEYLEELAGLVYRQRDARYRSELAENYERLARDGAFLEIELLCAHIVYNHSAVLLLRPVGPVVKDEGPLWLNQLAGMYLRWAKRKGYEAGVALLEPLPEAERRAAAPEQAEAYPYRWRKLGIDDPDALIKHVEGLPKAAELAILLEGTNVYGFLKSEAGVHRRNEQRASGERTQHLAQVSVVAPAEETGEAWLDELLEQRAEAERELASHKGKKPAAKPAAPEVVRVYQLDGQRHVRDLRTKVRNNDLAAVLEGDLDDFILAYLRETEAETAWDEPRA